MSNATEYEITSRKEIDATVVELETTRAKHEPFWMDADRFICPGLYRGQLTDADMGERRDDAILDSTAQQAWLDFRAGHLTHVTPPGETWLKVKIEDQDLAEYGPVNEWLDDSGRKVLAIKEEAGFYDTIESFHGNRGLFGNACMWLEERRETVMHYRDLPVGSWWIGLNEWGEAAILWRKFRMTVRGVVKKFVRSKESWGKLPARVRDAYDNSRYDETVDIGHFVAPNERANPRYVDARQAPFKSCYFEIGDPQGGYSTKERGFLSESGYDEFPAIFCPWDVIGEDTYGYLSPGRTVLGDVKELQHDEEQITMAVAKAVNPPTYGPAFYSGKKLGYMPGQYTPVPHEVLAQGGVKQLHDTSPQIFQLDARQDAKRRRMERGFYVDRFRMLDYLEDRQRTATEIAARQDERMRGLMGATSRFHRRGLGPTTERTFKAALRQGRLNPPPPELQGQLVKIEYESTMQQAMRAMGLAPIERVVGLMDMIAKHYPDIVHKVNLPQTMDEFAKGSSAPSRIINDDETFNATVARRDRQLAAQQQMEMAAQGAKAARDLGSIKTDEPNALTEIAGAVAKGAA